MSIHTHHMIVTTSLPTLLHYRQLLIEQLCQQADITIVGPTDHQAATALKGLGAKVVVLEWNNVSVNPWRFYRHQKTLARLIKLEQPSHILAIGLTAIVTTARVLKKNHAIRTAAMFTGMGYIYSGDSLKQRLLRLVVARQFGKCNRCYHAVICHNEDDQRYLSHYINPSKLHVVGGSGIDLKQFKPYKLPAKLHFLFLGRLLKAKGVMTFIDAARQVKRDFPEVQCSVAGKFYSGSRGVAESDIRQAVSEGVIDYLGYVDDVSALLRRTSVVVLPTAYGEGLPRVVLESLACGRPVITSNAPGCRTAIAHGTEGFLVAQQDTRGILFWMGQIANNPEMLEAMSTAARKRAEKDYDVNEVTKQTLHSWL